MRSCSPAAVSERVPSIRAHSEGISMQPHRRLLSCARFDGQHIKSASCRLNTTGAKELASHAYEVSSLVMIHSLFGPRLPWARGCSSLYFDKYQHLPVISHDVNFAFYTGHRIVSGHGRVSLP